MLQVCGITKHYSAGAERCSALRQVSLSLPAGALGAISGPSGSGKTTLLNIIGTLDHPDDGEVHLNGTSLHRLPGHRQEMIRRREIGFVFQDFALLPALTARENVELALIADEPSSARRRLRAHAALASVGVQDLAGRFPHQLSSGQKQRVAVARGLVKQPKLVLADEPTANLDSESAAALAGLLQALVHAAGVSFLIATHDRRLLQVAAHHFVMNAGRLVAPGQGG